MPEKQNQKPRKTTRDAEGSIIKRVEKRRASNGKTKDVIVYYSRVRYTDADGKKREKKRVAASFDDAKIIRRQLREEIEQDLADKLETEKKESAEKTFGELIDYYRTARVKEAVWRDGQLVEGFRTPVSHIEHELKILCEFLGDKLLSKISYDDLAEFRRRRLATPVKQKSRKNEADLPPRPTRMRKIASVNRELARLRTVLNLAVRRGWLAVNPFRRGDVLISQASEVERTRILSRAEERRLLAICTEEGDGTRRGGAGSLQNYKRTHLKPIIICALDTAMRYGEIMKLVWHDVDFLNGLIYAEGKNTKTLKKRIVPLTTRLRVELERIAAASEDAPPDARIFPYLNSKKAFKTACRLAGIKDLRFHDLRHTAITWMIQAGVPYPDVMKISGHTQMKTFLRYLNSNEEIAQSIAARLDAFRAAATAP